MQGTPGQPSLGYRGVAVVKSGGNPKFSADFELPGGWHLMNKSLLSEGSLLM